MSQQELIKSLSDDVDMLRDTIEAIIRWQDGLSYAMSPEKWVQKQAELNDILGLNDPISEKTQESS